MAVATQNQTTLMATSTTQSVITTVNTDKVTARCYSPFGFLSTDDSIDASVAFNGAYHEPATQTYLLGNGYRAFNPVLMRFHSPDSFSPFGKGGLNAYVYVENDPANRIDPSGHLSFNPAKLWRRAFKGSKHGVELVGIPTDAIPVKTSTYKIKEVGRIDSDAYWFSGHLKGDETLFIIAHGGNGQIFLAPGIGIEAWNLVGLLKFRNVLPGNYKRITLLSCRLGAGDAYTFAQEVSNLTGLKTKAYVNGLTGSSTLQKIKMIAENLQNSGLRKNIPVNLKMKISKYTPDHVVHAQKVQPNADFDIYSPRYFR